MTVAEPDGLVSALLRGVAHDQTATVREAWRALIALSPEAALALQAKIKASDWTIWPNDIHRDYLAILLGALHETDEGLCRRTLARLRGSRLHPRHLRTVEMADRLIKPQIESAFRGIRIAASSALPDASDAVQRVARWLEKLPRGDLAGIVRIDVVPGSPQLDYLGLYRIRFSGIVLVWPDAGGARLLRSFRRLRAQKTLYHEVGHHALGHLDGRQDAEQEDQANDYARRHLRQARPVLTSALRLVFLPLGPVASLCRLLSGVLDGGRQGHKGGRGRP